MNVYNIFGESAVMTDLNFEAIGRCHHLKQELETALRKRDDAFMNLTNSYRRLEQREIRDTVKYIDIESMRRHMSEIDDMSVKIVVLVEEYNHWAEKAAKKPIEFTKY